MQMVTMLLGSSLNKIRFLFLLCFAAALSGYSQNSTIDKDKKASGTPDHQYKVMLIPFEYKMYMSEIDKAFNEETKMTFPQIRNVFRKSLDMELWAEFKTSGSAFTFFTDSAKFAKDLDYIYQSIGYTYDPVDKPYAGIGEKNATQPKIKNGQIITEVSYDARFMNTKVNNPELLSYLNKKYGSETFVFINELDIKRMDDSYDPVTDTYKREVTVHYTVLNKAGGYLNAGVVKTSFSSKENDPKKVAKQLFPLIAKTIRTRIEQGVKKK